MIIILFLLIACYSDATWASMVKQHSITQTDIKAEYTLQRKRALLEASCAGRALTLTTILRENKTGRSMEILSLFPITAQDGHKVTVSTECVCAREGHPEDLVEIFCAAAAKFFHRTLTPLHTEVSGKELTFDFNLNKGCLSILGIKSKPIQLKTLASKESPADPVLLEVTLAEPENPWGAIKYDNSEPSK